MKKVLFVGVIALMHLTALCQNNDCTSIKPKEPDKFGQAPANTLQFTNPIFLNDTTSAIVYGECVPGQSFALTTVNKHIYAVDKDNSYILILFEDKSTIRLDNIKSFNLDGSMMFAIFKNTMHDYDSKNLFALASKNITDIRYVGMKGTEDITLSSKASLELKSSLSCLIERFLSKQSN